ncbi:ABC transporter ATP-binding protein [Mycolicibacterium nivoides]|uniref:ABC transporter ATP-binding protein n=1 Tax=Mycolicibacterium nivoides TaxID=2487344 RepID=UPI0008D13B02|nr:ABC transporter ATP-binding protein [Mycolicibacterium nivoides]MBN3512025.1 ABC transporter ATP-binding protein [Mycolicibacterium septicum]SEP61390.1 oligopeptide transport system ATP-binding protein [Mycobacterium sp. 88mf]SFF06003.1 oligopeptide transport system ATP-binding protein [Mycobacterium sp. 455mf]
MSELLVEVSGVTAGYDARELTLKGVSLAVEAGESVGLVGESGCGKTTLAKVIIGLVAPQAGTVLICGQAWGKRPAKDAMRRRVQMVFQDPYGALNPKLSAEEIVADSFHRWNAGSRRNAIDQARKLLEEVGLPSRALGSRTARLSGGQCQRVGIARALACGPDLLVADEPTSSLDVSVQAQILNLLLTLKEERGLSMLLISHDLAVVRYMTERAAVMHGGVIVEHGPSNDLFTHPRHPYTQLLLDSIPGKGPSGTADGDACSTTDT